MKNRSGHATLALWGALLALSSASVGRSQDLPAEPDADATSPIAQSIQVSETTADQEIERRLQAVLEATTWFESIEVTVDTGVVYLSGTALRVASIDWATDLARNTEGTTAVVNNIELLEASPWDLEPTFEQIEALAATFFRSLPLILIGTVLLLATWFLARASLEGANRLLARRMQSRLLRDVLSRAVSILVFILGLYVVLRISGLTGLAVTIIGGTGLLGLAIGFAFRDIAENFLASILISIQRPFAMGDLIQLDGHEGYVQRVNTRATLIMTRDGNHVQIPNAIAYKQTIVNYTANPRSRETFVVGIGYDDSISEAQSIALDVVRKHSAVLDDPEPLVLVENLAASTVNLRLYFWIDVESYSKEKVRSSIIRLTKSALARAGISMPDEAREVVFPQGVPVDIRKDTDVAVRRVTERQTGKTKLDGEMTHEAEGSLTSEEDDVERQARDARLPEGGANLL